MRLLLLGRVIAVRVCEKNAMGSEHVVASHTFYTERLAKRGALVARRRRPVDSRVPDICAFVARVSCGNGRLLHFRPVEAGRGR